MLPLIGAFWWLCDGGVKKGISMAKRMPTKVVVEYENLDREPVYVEGAQGQMTPQGSLYVSFFTDHIKGKQRLESISTIQGPTVGTSDRIDAQMEEPFGSGTDDLHMVRRVGANLIIPLKALKIIIPWLQTQVKQMERTQKIEQRQ